VNLAEVALGSEGLRVPRLGFGCFALSGVYGEVADDEAVDAIRRAIDLGASFLDTADVYGPFLNEQLVGRAIEGRREEVVLATKVGNVVEPDGSRRVDGSPTHVRDACERSLRRLGVDRIDLLYLHRVDRALPIEETVGAMGELVAAGKVRFIGLSEAAPATIRRAHATHPVTALQSEWSLWERGIEAAVLPTCRELGIGLVPFSPLGRGFLAGAVRGEADLGFDDARRGLPRFQGERLARNLELLGALEAVAAAHEASTAQVALAWLLAQGEDVVPIPGTRSWSHLKENVAAAALAPSAEEVATLARALPPGAAAGERYPPDFLARLDGEVEAGATGPGLGENR
jgi:aryl-alcohol dehydrogenase-like predicted oxidoreductase